MSVSGRTEDQQSTSTGTRDDFVWGPQAEALGGLYTQAMGAYNPGGAQTAAGNFQQSVLPGAQSAYNNMVGLTDPTSQIAAQTASLQAGLGQMFREQINPAITAGAIGAGQLGGGRQGVAQGVAAGQLGQAFTQGLGDIVARANQTSIGAAGMLPQLMQSQYMANMAPQTAGFDVLSQLAGILGSPAILSQVRNESQSSGSSRALGFGL